MTRRTDVPTLNSRSEDRIEPGAEPVPPTLRQSQVDQATERDGAFQQVTEREVSLQQPTRHWESGLTPFSDQRTLDAMPLVASASARSASELLPMSHTLESSTQQRPVIDTTEVPQVVLAAPPPAALPRTAPLWMQRARELSRALEAAIAQGEADTSLFTIARVERAHDAYQAGGFGAPEIAAVSEAVLSCYRSVLRMGADPAQLVAQGAEALFRALPPQVASWVSLTYLTQVVSELRSQTSEQTAMVRGTMRVLGWDVTHERGAVSTILAARSVSTKG